MCLECRERAYIDLTHKGEARQRHVANPMLTICVPLRGSPTHSTATTIATAIHNCTGTEEDAICVLYNCRELCRILQNLEEL